MSDAMGSQCFEGVPEIPVDLLEFQTSLRTHRSTCPLLVQPRFGELIQAVMQRMNLAGLHRETTGGRVTAEPFQQISTACQRLIHGEALGGTG